MANIDREMENINQKIPGILAAYSRRGEMQQPWDIIDLDNWDPPQGGRDVLCGYIEHAENIKRSNRWEDDGTRAVDKRVGNPVMYTYRFNFVRQGDGGWRMTVYALDRIEGGTNKRAICAIQRAGG